MGSTSIAHSEGLLSLVHDVLEKSKTSIRQIDVFAAGVGPGSFTGVRIGLATIKSFASVLGKPTIGFSSLSALAHSAGALVAMVNAYQGQVFVSWEDPAQEQAVVAESWCADNLASLIQKCSKVSFCGTGASLYWPVIERYAESIGRSGSIKNLNVDHILPSGILKSVRGLKPGSLFDLKPNYLRQSAAEIKLSKDSRY